MGGPRQPITVDSRRRWQSWLILFSALIIVTTLFLRLRESGIVGRVLLKGTPPAELAIKLDAASAKLRPNGLTTRHYVVSPDGGLANVFVSIKEFDNKEAPKGGTDPVIVEFRGAQLEPYVVGIRTGRFVRFQNSDPILHNLHFTPKPGTGNREVNFGLPPGNRTEPWYRSLYRWLFMKRPPPTAGIHHTFQQPEAFIRVKCDVHPWEFAYICVSDHPFFAVTDKNGRFRIPAGLPPGRYVLEARHLKAGIATQEIEISRNERKQVELTLEAPRPKR